MLVQVRQILRQNPYLLSKLITFLVFTSSILIFSCNGNHTHVESSAFEWFDDFNNESLDTNFWNVEYGNGCPDLCGLGNNEAQTYTGSKRNLALKMEN